MRILPSVVTLAAITCIAIAPPVRGADSGRITAFDFIQSQANELTEAGGLTTVGLSAGPKDEKEYVIAAAANNARMELARILHRKYAMLMKDFFEEIGLPTEIEFPEDLDAPRSKESEKTDKFRKYFQVAEAVSVRAALFDIDVDDERTITQTQGAETTAYVLILMDPHDMLSALRSVEVLYAEGMLRFHASQAFIELLDEIKRFAPHRTSAERAFCELDLEVLKYEAVKARTRDVAP